MSRVENEDEVINSSSKLRKVDPNFKYKNISTDT